MLTKKRSWKNNVSSSRHPPWYCVANRHPFKVWVAESPQRVIKISRVKSESSTSATFKNISNVGHVWPSQQKPVAEV